MNYKELYHSALANPMAIGGDTLSILIDRFPYAQALRVALARKNYEENGSTDGENARLVTVFPNWLSGRLLAEVTPITNVFPAEHTVVSTKEIITEVTPSETEPSTDDAVPVADIETASHALDDSGLVEHPVGMDYFAYEEKAADETDVGVVDVDVTEEVVPLSEATPHEKVSLYNDDHLPYSFLWWLNKTRMEYADTYRPYASDNGPAVYPTNLVNAPADEQILDHQIRENIFHLQSPEEKLSTAHAPETISFQVPKKTDPIIERFIREEPQIKPPQADKINLENKARKSAEDQLTLVTETLANIYVEQGLYPKAIAIYKKLSLKYPEKSTYFAARITELTNKLP
ncbi:MAG TPA: hypothetical protein VNQ80_06960 [Parapedobacter sp.]|uniref:hypothetical protein n=1 Tax=Parapedobacter sp. TaxID=1958893 RepID=UPI002CFC155E|nr:hypothetical protein [Parapedobacter sp.]HWK57057.1 hypothetical protein [Parapedobacter sp.]